MTSPHLDPPNPTKQFGFVLQLYLDFAKNHKINKSLKYQDNFAAYTNDQTKNAMDLFDKDFRINCKRKIWRKRST